MTTDPTAPTGPSGPRTPDGEANGVEAERPLSGSVKCVGAWKVIDCPNLTLTIICSSCSDLIDAAAEAHLARRVPMRFKYQPRHG